MAEMTPHAALWTVGAGHLDFAGRVEAARAAGCDTLSLALRRRPIGASV